MIRTQEDLENLIEEWGFVPFFENEIEGFSIKEQVDPKLWFTEEDGPWEWKGRIAVKGRCAYGKFFGKKAGFVSKKWFADLLNYRRTAMTSIPCAMKAGCRRRTGRLWTS